jgi:hypothetical protein
MPTGSGMRSRRSGKRAKSGDANKRGPLLRAVERSRRNGWVCSVSRAWSPGPTYFLFLGLTLGAPAVSRPYFGNTP